MVTLSLFFAAIALMLWIGDIRASSTTLEDGVKNIIPSCPEACRDEQRFSGSSLTGSIHQRTLGLR